MQTLIVIELTIFYVAVLARMKTELKFSEYCIDIFSEFMLLIMQIHMFWFMDGGIITGTPN
jgi:hypothetical protein